MKTTAAPDPAAFHLYPPSCVPVIPAATAVASWVVVELDPIATNPVEVPNTHTIFCIVSPEVFIPTPEAFTKEIDWYDFMYASWAAVTVIPVPHVESALIAAINSVTVSIAGEVPCLKDLATLAHVIVTPSAAVRFSDA